MYKVLMLLLLLLCSPSSSNAQATFQTQIERIEIDGKAVRTNYKVCFLAKGKWIEAATATGFVLPAALRATE